MTDQPFDKVWKPHPRQETFASLPDTIFEALYGGAAGGGKSELLIMLPLIRGFYKEPRFKGIIFRRTYPELESEIILRSREWYQHTGARFNEEKKRWSFPSGAIMQFGHIEYEQDVRKYDTVEFNYCAFDELTSFTEFQYVYISRTRCRSSSSNLPAIVRSATNPGNVGHAWVRTRFVDPAPYGTIMVEKASGIKRIFIQSLATDNPYLMQNDPQYTSRLQSLPEAERRAKLEGDWTTFEGQVFNDYREEHFPGEPENAVHVIEPFDVPSWWPRFLAIDWGYTALTYALWGALSPDDRLYIYREYAVKEAKTIEWATEIGNQSLNESLKDVVLCKSAWQNRGEEFTQHELFAKYSGLTATQAENDRILGKLLIQEYLRFEDKIKEPEAPFSPELAKTILNKRGVDSYNAYLASYKERRKEAIPKLQIFRNCKILRDTIPLCIYDKKSNASNKPSEDVREFPGDDPYDTLRYLICCVNSYLGQLQGEAQYREQEARAIERFQKDRDWTSYYRRMENLERKDYRDFPVKLGRVGRSFGGTRHEANLR
jgi:hypothetical protein